MLFQTIPKEKFDRDAPLFWAEVKNNLGNALFSIGELTKNTEILENAIAQYRESGDFRQQEQAHFEWASTQNNLGHTSITLGELQNNGEWFQDAAEAFRNALKCWTFNKYPEKYAMAQSDLGDALLAWSRRCNKDIQKLNEAIVAYQKSLAFWLGDKLASSIERVFYWQKTEQNLAAAKELLDERKAASDD